MNKNGIECKLYGPHDWHLGKCNSGLLNSVDINQNDTVVVHYLTIHDRLPCNKMILSVHEYTKIFNINTLNLNMFDVIQCVSDKVRIEQQINQKYSIISNVMDELVPNKKTNKNIAGIVGTIHPIKNVHVSLQRALDDGMRKIFIFGNIGDTPYYNAKIVPYLKAYPNRIFHVGYNENKQQMYDCITDVYHSSEFETWGYIKAECELTNTKYHGNDKTDGVLYMTNDEILEEWRKII